MSNYQRQTPRQSSSIGTGISDECQELIGESCRAFCNRPLTTHHRVEAIRAKKPPLVHVFADDVVELTLALKFGIRSREQLRQAPCNRPLGHRFAMRRKPSRRICE